MKIAESNEQHISLFANNLGRCISIATRWDLKAIKENTTDLTPFSVFGSYFENQIDYFENFKRALRLEFDNPNNGKGFEIDLKDKFLPMIKIYFDWYDKHKSETIIFEPNNFYKWIFDIAKDTEKEIEKYFKPENKIDTVDIKNPLIFDNQLLVDLHRDFSNYLWNTIDFDSFKNYFRKEPKKIVFHENLTWPEICYFFSNIEHKTTVVKFKKWVTFHIGGNNYSKNITEFIEMDEHIRKRLTEKGFTPTAPQKKALENKQKIDELFNRMQSI
jgi:hypothetical protein